jgi:hypothetical protein
VAVLIGLVLFIEGLKFALMPLGEQVGKEMPLKCVIDINYTIFKYYIANYQFFLHFRKLWISCRDTFTSRSDEPRGLYNIIIIYMLHTREAVTNVLFSSRARNFVINSARITRQSSSCTLFALYTYGAS